jgi:hypothetical protein
MKGKALSFPFIYFLESRLFNGLRPIQIKKSFSVLWLCPGCPKRISVSLSRGQASTPERARRPFDGIAQISAFLNKFRRGVRKCDNPGLLDFTFDGIHH